ncbi:MAG: M23 family metallopeptidase, partial [Bacteroidota bacterium]
MFKEFVNNRTLIMILAAFSLSVSSFSAYAQVYDYHPPLKIPMIMSGSFCEPRNGHFHAGIDLKTVGITGQTLHAIDDAVVYRIRISGRGYGRALYLLHPDSSLSVYAHMQRFMPEVEEAARKMQYKNKSFYLDTILQDSLFVYNKGECIGYSGNSGSSGGAHLHFEIRKMPSEHCINPQKFWSFNDNIKPQYRGIVFYDIDANHKTEAERSDYQHSGRVRNRDISLAQGKWGIGAEIIDRMNRTHNRYGILELIMLVNKDTVYHSKIDTFAWSNQKYTPAWFDAYFMETRSRYVQRCFREPGNKAGLFVNLKNDGVIELAEGDVKKIQLKARDGAGNWSGFRFTLKASDKEKPPHVSKKMYPAGKA